MFKKKNLDDFKSGSTDLVGSISEYLEDEEVEDDNIKLSDDYDYYDEKNDLDNYSLNDMPDDIVSIDEEEQPVSNDEENENEEEEKVAPEAPVETPKKKRGRPAKPKAQIIDKTTNDNDDDNSDNSNNNDDNDDVEPELPVVQQTPWTKKLLNLVGEDEGSINQFDIEFKYKRLYDPSNIKSPYYACFRKLKSANDTWETNNGLLSKSYLVADLEKLVENIKESIDIEKERVLDDKKFIIKWAGSTSFNVQMFDKNPIEKKLFSIFSGVKDIKDITNNISINVINSYGGKRILSAEYVINYMLDGKVYYDYFTLFKFRKGMPHKGALNSISSDLMGIQNIYEKCYKCLNNYRDLEKMDKFIKTISAKLKKKSRQRLLDIWNKLPDGTKNMYCLLFILSLVLSENFDVSRYSSISPIVSNFIESIVK